MPITRYKVNSLLDSFIHLSNSFVCGLLFHLSCARYVIGSGNSALIKIDEFLPLVSMRRQLSMGLSNS